ncbi:hypothetical protein PA25_21270 [Pseudoalteromonas sp. A25]|uniref:DUF1800 domain-containing protein n=1 Tax=Pseudoalteromonas sp. A25 TaxID=116092 RepID=UPI001260D8B4|nr:DUF1800 family protein [Pseudoalteromonas sp. A25]BBN82142.1 hypothetical protein PA25_21270 [Pseudoalteromonas sp. A25]
MTIKIKLAKVLACTLLMTGIGCGGSASSEQMPPTLPSSESDGVTIVAPIVSENAQQDQTFATHQQVVRFLQQATFGAKASEITELANTSASDWFKAQLAKEPSLIMPTVLKNTPKDTEEEVFNPVYLESNSLAFWQNAIAGPDQLRQRMAFALSQILVVSSEGGEELAEHPEAIASFQDLLIRNAFGNYRDILTHVTYSSAMGHYLTYVGNKKGDEVKGTAPDENYARELLQLFTLGVVALNQDGTEKVDQQGNIIELYSNQDITGLARVFTGLNNDEETAERLQMIEFSVPMVIFEEDHSTKPKSFLGLTIPANTDAKTSIDMALTHIFEHPNLAPFITKQLIQRFVTSNPSSDYVKRVADAFSLGTYTLPDNSTVGSNQRGCLSATMAAILFDKEARNPKGKHIGKVREPILRFTHWARAFEAKNITPMYQLELWDTSRVTHLAQHPYRSPSVFNFYRPGYKAPGSISGAANLVAPELAITNASSVPGYINFMTQFISGEREEETLLDIKDMLKQTHISVSDEDFWRSFAVDYRRELAVANDSERLIQWLNLLLTANQLSESSVKSIKQIIDTMDFDEEQADSAKVKMAILLVMTSPDYLVQR